MNPTLMDLFGEASPPGGARWFQDLTDAPMRAFDDLLLRRASLGPWATEEPEIFAIRVLRIVKDAGHEAWIDSALAEWVARAWRKETEPSGVRVRDHAWDYLGRILAWPAFNLRETAKKVAELSVADPDFLRDMTHGSSCTPHETLSEAIRRILSEEGT